MSLKIHHISDVALRNQHFRFSNKIVLVCNNPALHVNTSCVFLSEFE